jgi:probable rRNA maturation factor
MTARRPGGSLRLIATVSDDRGRPIKAGGLGRWLARAAPSAASGIVSIALIPDATMRRLNRSYRRSDRPTDVLSFPAGAVSRGRPRRLGDIAIARGVAARQARLFGHTQAVEWRVLALHGLLHLLGYDHDTDRGEMSRLEERLRRRAGLPAGLTARGPARTRR